MQTRTIIAFVAIAFVLALSACAPAQSESVMMEKPIELMQKPAEVMIDKTTTFQSPPPRR